MSSCFGQVVRLSLFGQSHGEAIGITIDGFPAGMTLDMPFILGEMARRAPGQSKLTTQRREADQPEILSGVLGGVTTGQPITCIIRNQNARSADYGDGVDLVRPGHADYTGHVRYFGFEPPVAARQGRIDHKPCAAAGLALRRIPAGYPRDRPRCAA